MILYYQHKVGKLNNPVDGYRRGKESKMKKIGLIVLMVSLLFAATLNATVMAAGGPQTQEINSTTIQVNTNPLKTEFLFSYPKPGEEMLIIYRVQNTSIMIEEVIYNLTADIGLGGIEAVIDYDGPFGPKQPENYNWNKVPVYPGEEQWLFVKFPIPATYVPTLNVKPSVKRHTGDRG